MWTRIGAPHESLVSISLDRGDVGKDFMAEIDTRTGKLVLGDVCRPSESRMEALGRWRLVLGVITLDTGDAGKDFMVEIDTRTCVGRVSGRMEARGSTTRELGVDIS